MVHIPYQTHRCLAACLEQSALVGLISKSHVLVFQCFQKLGEVCIRSPVYRVLLQDDLEYTEWRVNKPGSCDRIMG